MELDNFTVTSLYKQWSWITLPLQVYTNNGGITLPLQVYTNNGGITFPLQVYTNNGAGYLYRYKFIQTIEG